MSERYSGTTFGATTIEALGATRFGAAVGFIVKAKWTIAESNQRDVRGS
ncbi:hypothetical protein ZOSMA_12G00300 [Zostera marina]|uniref:Uncharacterized protein n=1 Tax=Zostera marina TaxID=29655 RepID=A0A0K9PZA9_ZOSMR|nr:hypothetical protein ZOSMA_12G00300 [Zostera marina]